MSDEREREAQQMRHQAIMHAMNKTQEIARDAMFQLQSLAEVAQQDQRPITAELSDEVMREHGK